MANFFYVRYITDILVRMRCQFTTMIVDYRCHCNVLVPDCKSILSTFPVTNAEGTTTSRVEATRSGDAATLAGSQRNLP